MDSNLKLTINDSVLLNEVNLDIGKINVVGGVNGSGKTTVAKVLYCFLKVLSDKKGQYLHKEFVKEVNYFNKIMNYERKIYFNQDFKNDDSYDNVLKEFKRAKKFFFDNNLDKDYFDPNKSYQKGYDSVFGKIESLIDMIEGKSEDFNFRILDYLMKDEDILVFKESGCILKNNSFNFISNDLEESYFDRNVLVSDVFYMDTLSILDLKGNHILFKEHIRHLKDSLNEESEWWDEESLKNFDILEVLDDASIVLPDKNKEIYLKIENIIKGQYKDFDVDFGFKKQNSENISFTNTTPSGIKQIGVIQILLSKGKLKEGSFLIIDEPEVNLHPEWQFKFAEILVLLAKELSISLYLNSHSPMFIEAIEVLTEYYGLEDETNFYLTEKQDNDKYGFVKISYDNLFELYDNLANPYDAIEVYRLKAEYKKGNL